MPRRAYPRHARIVKAYKRRLLRPIFNDWFTVQFDERRNPLTGDFEIVGRQPCGCGLTVLACDHKPELVETLTEHWLFTYGKDGGVNHRDLAPEAADRNAVIPALVMTTLEEMGLAEPVFTGFVNGFDGNKAAPMPELDPYYQKYEWTVYKPETGATEMVYLTTARENTSWYRAYLVGYQEGAAARAEAQAILLAEQAASTAEPAS